MEAMSPSPSFHYLQQQHQQRQKLQLPEDEADYGSSVCGDEGGSLQEGLLFSDSLKDLRNLHSQLYSAAEYFESFYRKNAQKPTVITSLKDYTIEALVSTVDHLSFVAYKVNDFLMEKSDEVAEAEFRAFSAEQRVRSCQELIDREGRSQQSPVIKAPKYHKHYILPSNPIDDRVGDNILESVYAPVIEPHQCKRHNLRCKTHKQQTETSATLRRQHEIRKTRSLSPSPIDAVRSSSSSPSKRTQHPPPSPRVGDQDLVRNTMRSPKIVPPILKEKIVGSPLPRVNPLARATSLSSRLPAQYARAISSPARSPVLLHSEKSGGKEASRSVSRGKRFLKSLLTRRRWREDEYFYSFLDEY